MAQDQAWVTPSLADAADTADLTEADALRRDCDDELAPFRERFYRPQAGPIYLDGNSLGLLSRDAEVAVLTALDDWKRQAIGGWLEASPPWFYLAEQVSAALAPLLGAAPDQVAVTGSTTVNLHQLVATFYRPAGARRRILATALDFPSDLYALRSQIALRGGDPQADLVLVPSLDGRTIDEEAIIAALRDPRVALAVLPSVLYRSGQLLDLRRIAAAATASEVTLGLDCAHSAGIVHHHLDEWGVDFAVWCTYKYLNGGPGSTAALYVNRRHFGTAPGLAGWWGSLKERQFDMAADYQGAEGAGAWQIGTPPILSTAPLLGALRLHHEAGLDRLRAKSLAQTSCLRHMLEAGGLTSAPYNYAVGTPREDHRRGGHLAVEHPLAAPICKALKARGVVPDFRPPNVIRLAPVPLYTSYHDLWQAADHLRRILDEGEHKRYTAERDVVA